MLPPWVLAFNLDSRCLLCFFPCLWLHLGPLGVHPSRSSHRGVRGRVPALQFTSPQLTTPISPFGTNPRRRGKSTARLPPPLYLNQRPNPRAPWKATDDAVEMHTPACPYNTTPDPPTRRPGGVMWDLGT